MTRRVCGSCRFFKTAGFDNMGWCTHPKRRLGTDALLFVRSLELHCRNDWASDLWQAATGGANDASFAATPQPPVSIDDVRFLTANRMPPSESKTPHEAAAGGEDVVVGEVPTDAPAGDATRRDGAKSSLRRAHEELRLRNRERRAGMSPASSYGEFNRPLEAMSAEGPDGTADGAMPPTGGHPSRPMGDVPPVTLGEIGRPFPKMTSYPDDREVFGVVPERIDGFDLPRIEPPKKPKLVGRAGFDDDHDRIAPWDRERPAESGAAGARDAFVETAEQAAPETQPLPDRRAEPRVPRNGEEPAGRQRILPPRRREGERTFDLPVGAEAQEPKTVAEQAPVPHVDPPWVQRGERHRPPMIDPAVTSKLMEQIVSGGAELRGQTPKAEAEATFKEPVEAPRQRRESRLDDGYDPSYESSEPDNVVDAFPGVPRMCRTCRDFRPSETGDRGWCTNKWAFSHRRMVDADELPCETTIGGWWLASDEQWLSTLDVSAHSQPTPLLDNWMTARAAAEEGSEMNPPLRRRRRS